MHQNISYYVMSDLCISVRNCHTTNYLHDDYQYKKLAFPITILKKFNYVHCGHLLYLKIIVT